MNKKLLRRFVCAVFALALLFAAAGCGEVGELREVFEDDGQPYELIYYMPYIDANPPQDIAPVEKALNKVLPAKLGAPTTIRIKAYPLSEYAQKVQGAITSTARFDVCFTSNEFNPYLNNVNMEAFLPLDWLLPNHAPATWAAFDEAIWDQARVNGKIYASVNEQILPRTFGYIAKSGVNLADFLAEVYPGSTPATVYSKQPDPFALLERYLDWLKENNRGAGGKIYPLHTDSTLLSWFLYDDLGTGVNVPGAVKLTDGTFRVVNQFESADYSYLVDKSYEWKEKGYLSTDVYDLEPDRTWKPGYKEDTLLRLGDPHYFTSFVIGSMNAVSSTSENPVRAMKFIELMRTDEEVHNILQYGVEDVNYIKDPEDPKRIAEFITGSGYNNSGFGWGLGCEFQSYRTEDQPVDIWEQVRAINRDTAITDLVGFSFDTTGLDTKIANCRAVVTEYESGFEKASYIDKAASLAEFRSRLKAAGADDIVAAKQQQLDAFLADRRAGA